MNSDLPAATESDGDDDEGGLSYGPNGRCSATSKRSGRRCKNRAMPNGTCKFHGGKSNGDGGPHGNAKALKHGAYSKPGNLLNHLDADAEAWVFSLYDSYLEAAPFDASDEGKAERLLMTSVKVYQEWSAEEVLLREGQSESVEVAVSGGEVIVRDEEHHLRKTANSLNDKVRHTLKDLGVLDDPDSKQADATRSLAEVLGEAAEEARAAGGKPGAEAEAGADADDEGEEVIDV